MMQALEIPVELIDEDPSQPRKSFPAESIEELGNSLVAQGQLVLIIVTRVNERYQLVEGHRRLLAAKLVGLKQLKAIVLPERPTPSQLLLMQLTMNCMREDLSPLERAESYARLIEMGVAASEIAKQLGISKSTVTQYLSHMSLPDNLKAMLQDGRLTTTVAYHLSRMPDDERNEAIKGLGEPDARAKLIRKARRKKETNTNKQFRSVRYELPDCSVALRTSKTLTIDGLIDVLTDLLRACRKARTQKIEPSTMALVLRDKHRAASDEGAHS